MIFIHLPRTGGTAIELALAGQNWWHINKKTKHINWKHAKKIYKKEWNDYLKFSVVRNPWDLMVSLYYSHSGIRCKNQSWAQWIKNPKMANHEQNIFELNSPLFDTIGPEVDDVLRFESLNDDFHELCIKRNIKLDLEVYPNSIEKTGGNLIKNRAHHHYSSHYNDAQRDIVRKIFEKDIERYQYTFKGPTKKICRIK
jgi:hypothetical protein